MKVQVEPHPLGKYNECPGGMRVRSFNIDLLLDAQLCAVAKKLGTTPTQLLRTAVSEIVQPHVAAA